MLLLLSVGNARTARGVRAGVGGWKENHTLVSECWKSWDREGGGWWVEEHRTLVSVCLKNWDRTEEGKGGRVILLFPRTGKA